MKTKIIARDNDDSEMTVFLKWKLDELKTNLRQILPKHRRQKRWDALGRAWKWMSGSPDADDLQLINSGINQLTENNNRQTSVNDNIFDGTIQPHLCCSSLSRTISNGTQSHQAICCALRAKGIISCPKACQFLC